MQTQPKDLTPEYGDSLFTVSDFCSRYPNLYSSASKLRWLLRDRSSNGLKDSGAVVEFHVSGTDRPRLLIHAPSFFNWMRSGGSQGSYPKA
jgi:hypothetical protein